MEFENLLKDLIQQEDIKMKKYVLFMLHKFSHLVKQVESEDRYLPLLVIKNNRLTLVYKNDEVDMFEYIFRDYEEILIILQKHFNEDKVLYFYFESAVDTISKEEILAKIDESIAMNDEKSFYHYSLQLKKKR